MPKKKHKTAMYKFRHGEDRFESRIRWIRIHPRFTAEQYRQEFGGIYAVVYSELGKLKKTGVIDLEGSEYILKPGFGGVMEKKKDAGLWIKSPETPEGKYLVVRRDGTIPRWGHFVLGARDPAAPTALRCYADAAELNGMNKLYVGHIRELADEFEAYRDAFGTGDPDKGKHREDDPEVLTAMRIKSLEPLRMDTSIRPSKTLENTSVSQAKDNVRDLKTYGNSNLFKLISKAWSEAEGWMKSTKAMEIPGAGCVVQVTTQQDDQVAEALTFVPNVVIEEDEEGRPCLVAFAFSKKIQKNPWDSPDNKIISGS